MLPWFASLEVDLKTELQQMNKQSDVGHEVPQLPTNISEENDKYSNYHANADGYVGEQLSWVTLHGLRHSRLLTALVSRL